MKKSLQISNTIALIITIFINYLSNTRALNDTTIGEVSKSYSSLFTPAGYTFAIWGVIYMLLLGFVIYQGRSLFVKTANDDFILKTGWWFVASCAFNSLWVFAWIYEFTGLSCIFIFLLLFSLLKIVMNNRMELDDKPFPVIAFLWWPFVIYSGWVTVASIANVSTYLVKINWSGWGLAEVHWALIMISIAIAINLLITWERNMREFALVGAWALIGIGKANAELSNPITTVAYIGAVLLLLSSMLHGFKNHKTNPFIKFLQWRKS